MKWKGVNCPTNSPSFYRNQLVVADYYNEGVEEKSFRNWRMLITQINGIPV